MPDQPDHRLTGTPRQCAFCGGRPLTNEHVWPNWARALVPGVGALPYRRVTDFDEQNLEDHTFYLRPFDLKVKRVCAECNNGWMSELESKTKPLLVPGMHGRGKRLSRGQQRTLAAWAFKTALVFNLTRPDIRGVPVQHYDEFARTQEPTEQCLVWMGAYTGPEPGVLYQSGMAISRPGEQVTVKSAPNVFVTTFTFGPMFFQVFASGDQNAFDVRGTRYTDTRLRQIWPAGSDFTWTPTGPSLSAEELPRYADLIYDELSSHFKTARP